MTTEFKTEEWTAKDLAKLERKEQMENKEKWVVMPRGHNGIDAVQIWPEMDGMGRICTLTNGQDDKANLIAAAPELLRAIRGVLHHNEAVKEKFKLPTSLIHQLEDLIAKVKGRE